MSPEERIAQIQRTFIEMDRELQQAGAEIYRLERVIADLIQIADDIIGESEPLDNTGSREKFYKATENLEWIKRSL
jgi:hypothetical protein